jgi:hypothetical protein
VHVSPIIIKVAVPLPQHSLIFGHIASAQTVAKFNPAEDFFIAVYLAFGGEYLIFKNFGFFIPGKHGIGFTL